MKAVALTRYLPISDPESLIDVELPQPTATGHDLLVKVEAVSVNPVDYKQRKQTTVAARVLGWDAAGVVEAVGGEVSWRTVRSIGRRSSWSPDRATSSISVVADSADP